jgi:hypothetical protein
VIDPPTTAFRRVSELAGCRSMTRRRIWLFDLDDTLHDASAASMDGSRRR